MPKTLAVKENNMSSPFSKKFMDNSPLEYSAPVTVGYVSTRASLQNMFDNISSAADKTLKALADPQVQANRLEDRIERRKQRADKATTKANELQNKSPKLTKKEEKKVKRLRKRATRLESKEEKLKARKTKYQEKADKDYNKKLQQMQDLYGLKNPSEVDFGLRLNEAERIYNENKTTTDPKWENLPIAEKTKFTDIGKIYPNK